jgi:histidinol phosphatase-like PHP family hydrolase
MKPTSQNIYDILKHPNLKLNFEQMSIKNPQIQFQEITIEEAFLKFSNISEIIMKAIHGDLFDNISFIKRNSMWLSINAINQTIASSTQQSHNRGNQNVTSYINSTIQLVQQLDDIISSIDFFGASNSSSSIDEALKLSDLIKKYEEALSKLTGIEKAHSASTMSSSEIKQIGTEVADTKTKIDKTEKEIALINEQTRALAVKAEQEVKTIKESEAEIEGKKLSINTFAQNIETYKTSIEKLEKEAIDIISKDRIIESLISQAERALSLRSAEGISAAFSSRHTELSNQRTEGNWLWGAVVCVVFAIAFTAWIVTGYKIDDPNAVTSIIGRVAAVAISISGATFCAKQYIKQKNIIEDYAYKSVLAKSIVAFAEEIKKSDESRVAEYLTKVLDEIHKDPLRDRNNNMDKGIGLNANKLLSKLMDKIPKADK